MKNSLETVVSATSSRLKKFIQSVMLVFLVVYLSGCVAAAAPILVGAYAASVALTGFFVYKTVQTSTGGSVSVQFREEDGERSGSIPYASKIAVWPFGQGEVIFADRLQKSGRYTVTTPGTVSKWLREQGISEDTSLSTESEWRESLDYVCQRSGAGQVHAAISRGVSAESKIWSLKRGAMTYVADIRAYSCQEREFIWEDELALVAEMGSKQPSEVELFEIGATAWAERVIELQRGSAKSPSTENATESSTKAASAIYDQQLVSSVQRLLAAQGFYDGVVDGIYGPNTRKAIESYQSKNDLEVSGRPSKLLLRYMQMDGTE